MNVKEVKETSINSYLYTLYNFIYHYLKIESKLL